MAPGSDDPFRILVVDDEESNLTFAERALRAAGYEVVVVSGGPEALRIVEEQAPFDVFVIDFLMPEMRGDELARQLHHTHLDAKVLYFTGYSAQLFNAKPTLWQNEAFIEKPVTVKGLLEAVSLILFGHTRGPEGDRPTHS
jgi:two-component system cell cycle sensor histidine kinase/response regulator CckA